MATTLGTRPQATGDVDELLLERTAPQAALGALCARATAGSGGVALVEGPAGIGKSALLGAVGAWAGDTGLRVLCARAGQFEHDLPWGVARDLLGPALQCADGTRREGLLAGAAAHAAPVLDPAAPASAPAAGDPTALALHGLHRLVANLAAEQPLVLMVDDAHWADRPSLRWLAHLAARAGDLPVALVVAARPDGPGGDVIAAAAPATTVLALEALSEHAAGLLARRTLGENAEEAFVRACHSASGGNPFLLRELTAELAREHVAPTAANAGQLEGLRPAGLSRAVLLRLARLPAPAVRLAEAVAILGVHATVRDAAALAGLPDARAERAADELATADILVPGLPLRFVHPVVRGVVEDELPAVRRARWHARAAELLEGAGADAVAIHLLAAEPCGATHAVATLRGAAELAVERGAPDGAVTYLRRALVEPPAPSERAPVLLELGDAEAQAGDPAAIDTLHEALNCAALESTRVTTALALARVLVLADRAGEAVRMLDATRAILGEDQRELALRLEAAAVDAARQDFAVCEEMGPRIGRLREQVAGDTHAERLLLVSMAMHSAQCGDSASETVDLAERGLAGGRLPAEESSTSIASHLGIHALVVADRPDLALAHLDAMVDAARARGSAPGVGIASMCRSHARLQHGAVVEAEEDAWASLAAARASGWASIVPWALRCLIDSLLEQGRLAEAADELKRSDLTGDLPDRPFFEALASARGRLAIARGDPEAGVRDLLTLGRRLAETGAPNPGLSAWRSNAAPALEALGREDEARTLVEEEVELARAYGAPRPHAAALRTSATLASRRGRPEQLDLLRESTEIAETSPSELERAHCLVALGAALRRHNRRADAREPLRRGLEAGARCGATVLAEHARRELRACGVRPRRPARSGPAALTAAELGVARLAAEGASNREIAEALFVSLRTVETHLTHAYRKLGIDARGGLATALRR